MGFGRTSTMAPTSSAHGLLLAAAACASLVSEARARGYAHIHGPQPIELLAGERTEIAIAAVNCSGANLTLEVGSSDSRVFVCDARLLSVECGSNGSLPVRGVAIGFAQLLLSPMNDNVTAAYDAAVIRPRASTVDMVFVYGIVILLGVGMICFGATLDLDIIRQYVKKPKSLLIGLACQCTLMPLIAFAIAWATSFPPPLALGVFASGCVPAGGGSNAWTKLLRGDVDLSVVLTFVGTIAAFGTMPLWIYTLGSLLYEGSPVTIPYLDMLQTLLMTTVPLAIGVLVKRFLPKVGKLMFKAVFPLSVIFLVYVFTFGGYANFYIFEFISREPKIWTVLLLPYGGMLISGLVAFACRESRAACITIAIEVCIQNVSTAIILLRFSLAPPWSDMALCVPALVGMFMALPLALVCISQIVYRKIRGRQNKPDSDIKGPLSDVKEVELSSSLLGKGEKEHEPCEN